MAASLVWISPSLCCLDFALRSFGCCLPGDILRSICCLLECCASLWSLWRFAFRLSIKVVHLGDWLSGLVLLGVWSSHIILAVLLVLYIDSGCSLVVLFDSSGSLATPSSASVFSRSGLGDRVLLVTEYI